MRRGVSWRKPRVLVEDGRGLRKVEKGRRSERDSRWLGLGGRVIFLKFI